MDLIVARVDEEAPVDTVQDGQARRMGRPAISEEDRKSATLRFRATEGLREKVEAAAAQSGVTLSEELERRLLESFHFEPILQVIFTDDRAKDLFLNTAAVFATVRRYAETTGTLSSAVEWPTHDATRAGLRAALAVLIEHAIPPARDPNEAPADAKEARQERLYAVELENMLEFGTEFSEMLTGQATGPAADLNVEGAPEH